MSEPTIGDLVDQIPPGVTVQVGGFYLTRWAEPDCERCRTGPSTGPCCSSHQKRLCHGCYRRTHFVEVCVAGCPECERDGLDPTKAVTR